MHFFLKLYYISLLSGSPKSDYSLEGDRGDGSPGEYGAGGVR